MTLLTPHQKFFSYRNTFNLYNNFIITAKATQYIKTSDLEASLDQLLSQRLLLRANVNTKDFTLRELPEIHARDCYDIIPDMDGIDDKEEILKVCMDIHRTVKFELDVSLPLWRIFIYKDWYIIALDHTLYDGTTAMSILNDLFLLIQGKAIEEEEDVDVVNLKYEEFLRISLLSLGKVVFHELIKPKLYRSVQDFFSLTRFYKNNNWFKVKGEQTRLDELVSLNRLVSIPNERLKPVLQTLKIKKLSFQTLLNYATVKAFDKFAPDSSIKISIPINLRKFLNVSPYSYGLFVTEAIIPVTPASARTSKLNLDEPLNWDLLQHLESYLSLSSQLQRKSLVASLKYVSGLDRFSTMSKATKANHPSTIEFSNLRAPSNELIEQWIFSQTADDFSCLFPCSVISNENCTNITLVGHICLTGDSMFDRFTDQFEKELDSVLNLFDELVLSEVKSC